MRKLMKHIFICIAVLALSNGINAKVIQASDSNVYRSAQFVHDWNAKMTDIIMEDGFSPAVIAKHHAYANIAAYTAAQPGFAQMYRPLTGQINLFTNPPFPDTSLIYDWRLCAIAAYRTIVNKVLYRSQYADSMYKAQIEAIEEEYAEVKDGDDIVSRSIKHGESVPSHGSKMMGILKIKEGRVIIFQEEKEIGCRHLLSLPIHLIRGSKLCDPLF
jgi:hypothetical protein